MELEINRGRQKMLMKKSKFGRKPHEFESTRSVLHKDFETPITIFENLIIRERKKEINNVKNAKNAKNTPCTIQFLELLTHLAPASYIKKCMPENCR